MAPRAFSLIVNRTLKPIAFFDKGAFEENFTETLHYENLSRKAWVCLISTEFKFGVDLVWAAPSALLLSAEPTPQAPSQPKQKHMKRTLWTHTDVE